MIHLESISGEPSAWIRGRAKNMWAVRTSASTTNKLVYRVTPYGAEFDHHNKTKRIVVIDLDNRTAECADRFTGDICEANADFVPGNPEKPKTGRMCSHVYAVLRQMEINLKKQSRAA